MRKNLLLIMISFALIPPGVVAQDTIPDLIISEARMDAHPNSYFELYNAGDTALDLSLFLIDDPQSAADAVLYFDEGLILGPKETYVFSNKYEEVNQNWHEIHPLSDKLLYQWEFGELFDQGILIDSITPGYNVLRPFGGRYGLVLYYKYSEQDSMIIDCFNWNIDEFGNTYKETGGKPIAGVVEPVLTNTIIRKSHITQGNLGNWDASRGTDAADSDWLLASHLSPPGLPFTTVGNHGDYPISVTAKNPGVTVDLTNGTLTVPWGIYRGDSIIKELNLGDGMAWWYIEKPIFEDSVHTVVQTGDILQVKAFGTQITNKDLAITVSSPAIDMNLVFPRRNINYPDPADPPGTVAIIGGTPYYVTQDMPGIDTIGNVPFATRVDSLYRRIEWAPNATVKIIWSDGQERVDLINGDILEVTAENGDKKQYYIDVQDYVMSENAFLSAITWPDITQDDKDFDYSWVSDTIPGFSSVIYQYNIKLRPGSTNVPALTAYSEDLNAKISMSSAVSLKGGFDERTTVFTVKSETDSVELKYSVTFKVEESAANKQKFYGDPFFSEYHNKFSTTSDWLEVCNPGNQPLDLSGYLLARGLGSPADVVQANLPFTNRYQLYVPGFRFTDSASVWDNEGYKTLLTNDFNVDPYLEPNGDVFVIASRNLLKTMENRDYITQEDWNISFPSDMENEWGIMFGTNDGLLTNAKEMAYYLFKIDNDSIFAGTKALGDMEDLILVDAIGFSDGTTWFANIGGYVWTGNKGHKIVRKPEIWQGNPSYIESGGTTPENSEWTWANQQDEGLDWAEHFSTIGNHLLAPVTAYMSTVGSLVYLVDEGYLGVLGITGISNGETVDLFIGNLIIPDTGQVLKVRNSSDGAFVDPTAAVSNGDTLIVTAADGKTVTKYLLSTAPLDNNTDLVAKGGSGLIISEGKVSGFAPGTSLETILNGVETSSVNSILNIVDGAGALVPLKAMTSKGIHVPVMASHEIWFEVVAQNGDRKLYQLAPNSMVSDAYVLSSVYIVNQADMVVSSIPDGTAVSGFFANITVAEGAVATLLDKAGYVRTLGNIVYDDVLKVVSQDQSTTVVYALNFDGELINAAPIVSVGSANISAQVDISKSVTATVIDDGLPNPPGALTYAWSIIGGEAANVTIANPDQLVTDVTFSAAGSYLLQIAVNDGELESTATIDVTVNPTGIDINRSEFRMFPNPTSESVVLELENWGGMNPIVSIYTITGKALYNGIIENSRMVVDVSSFDAGMYFVTVESGDEYTRQKLTILK